MLNRFNHRLNNWLFKHSQHHRLLAYLNNACYISLRYCWQRCRALKLAITLQLDLAQSNKRSQHAWCKTLYSKAQNKKPYLCIFSQFSADGNLADYCHHYLQELHKAGCDIVVVSTSPSFSKQALSHCKPLCKAVLHRSNDGRDLYSYKVGFDFSQTELTHYDKVIFANDSVVGPLFDLSKLINYGDDLKLDLWGAADSHAIQYHLQSYFLVFNKNVATSQCFKRYWSNIKILTNKAHIIFHYELNIAKHFKQHGYKVGALCEFYDLIDKAMQQHPENSKQLAMIKQRKLNPTHFLWDYMITEQQFPFIKKELILNNPLDRDLSTLPNIIKHNSQYDINLIKQLMQQSEQLTHI